MIENNPTNVEAAFDMLLEEVEAEIDFVNKAGAKGFEKRDYEEAKEALEHAAKLTAFRDKTVGLREEWEQISELKVDEDEETVRSQRQNLGRLRRGLRTPEKAYYKPVLQALSEMGGSGPMSDVLSKVEAMMKSVLKKVDYEPLSSSPDMPRWRNAAQWARNSMVNAGLLKNDSPRGVWEISDKGRRFIAGKAD